MVRYFLLAIAAVHADYLVWVTPSTYTMGTSLAAACVAQVNGQTVSGTALVCLANSSVLSVLSGQTVVTPVPTGGNAFVGMGSSMFGSGAVLSRVIMFANGSQPIATESIWTGCDVTGGVAPNCQDFTLSTEYGIFGVSEKNSKWMNAGTLVRCDSPARRLYCYLPLTFAPTTPAPTTITPTTTTPTTTTPSTSPTTTAPTTTTPTTLTPSPTASPTTKPPATSVPTSVTDSVVSGTTSRERTVPIGIVCLCPLTVFLAASF